MKVEIWSDIMCPWCYIGKRRFEKALKEFNHRNEIEIEWKSFQLNPHMKTEPDKSIIQYLADLKGWTIEHSVQAHDHVTSLAKAEGLQYNFETAVVANSFDAHRLIQYAKKQGKGDAIEERLFKAYFTEGANIADHAVLAKLGAEVGLDTNEVTTMLNSDVYSAEVEQDVYEAQTLGCRGVPFFVMDRKYGVAGAQMSDVFLQTLERSFADWQKENKPQLNMTDGAVCTPEGCD